MESHAGPKATGAVGHRTGDLQSICDWRLGTMLLQVARHVLFPACFSYLKYYEALDFCPTNQ